MPPQSTARFLFLDGLRGIAALFVVLRHMSGGYLPSNIRFSHAHLAVDLFFLLSGFVLTHAYHELLASKKITRTDFLRRRLARLYPVFALSTILYASLYFAKYITNRNTPFEGLIDIVIAAVTTLLLIPWSFGSSKLFVLNGVIWSLFFEALTNVAFAIANQSKIKKYAIFTLAISLPTLAISAHINNGLDNGFLLDKISVLTGLSRSFFGFSLGLFLYLYINEIPKLIKNISPWIGISSICVIFSAPDMGRWNMEFELLSVIIAFPLVILICASHEPKFAKSPLEIVGNASYPLYVLHLLFLEVTYFLICQITHSKSPFEEMPYLRIFVPLFIISSIILCILIEKKIAAPIRVWTSKSAKKISLAVLLIPLANYASTEDLPPKGLQSTLTPQHFGAIADDQKDDTEAIQQALNTAQGRTVHFPPGRYLCGEIALPNRIAISGQGAELICPAGATSRNGWWQAAGARQGGRIEGLTFDYRHNPNGKHLLVLGNNPHGWIIRNVTFTGMRQRNAIRAHFDQPGGGDITLADCIFTNGQGAGATAFYATRPHLNISGIRISGNRVEDCGSTLFAVNMINNQDDDGAGRWGAFTGMLFHDNTLHGNGSGQYGTIPTEFWGHDHITVVDNTITAATRGIGLGWCRGVLCANNRIENQTLYAHELGGSIDVVVSQETVINCASFISNTDNRYGLRSVTITGNTVTGTGRTDPAPNTYFIACVAPTTPVGGINRDWIITGNTFSDPRFISGCIRVVNAANWQISGNTFRFPHDQDGFQAVNVSNQHPNGYADAITITGNSVQITADHPKTERSGACFYWSGNGNRNGRIAHNRLELRGDTAGHGFAGIGSHGTPTTGVGTVAVIGNLFTGTWPCGLRFNDTSGLVLTQDNDFHNATVHTRYALHAANRPADTLRVVSGHAPPDAGTWRRGDRCLNTAFTAGSPSGWVCTADGTPGTWASMDAR